jgi:phosphoglycerate dehydrogenase-like enzyme
MTTIGIIGAGEVGNHIARAAIALSLLIRVDLKPWQK